MKDVILMLVMSAALVVSILIMEVNTSGSGPDSKPTHIRTGAAVLSLGANSIGK